MAWGASFKSKPAPAASPAPGHPLARGLVGCWMMNAGAGSAVFDCSGNGLDGTLASGATRVPRGISAGASASIPVAGAESRVDLTTGGDLTMVFSLRSGGSSGSWHTIGFGDSAWANYLLIQNDVDSDQLKARMRGGGGNIPTVTSAGAISTVQFESVVVVKKGTVLQLYRNGQLVGSAGNQNYEIAASLNLGSALQPPSYGIDCRIRYCYLYGRALGASEVAWLYRDPFAMFVRRFLPELPAGTVVDLAGSASAQSSASGTLGLVDERAVVTLSMPWLAEALFAGATANAFKLGTTPSLGWFWTRRLGCTALYRGRDMETLEFGRVLAVAAANAGSISPPGYLEHQGGSRWFYVVRRFDGIGRQERTCGAAARLALDADGDVAAPAPNAVFAATAGAAEGQRIALEWFYCPLDQQAEPVRFNIYHDRGSGQIDYAEALGTVEYEGRRFYRFKTAVLAAGTHMVAVRAQAADGTEDDRCGVLKVQLGTSGPAGVELVSVEAF